jgi:rhamnulokinase
MFVTVDLGGTSGRVVVGELNDGRLQLDEVHRFPNQPQGVGSDRHWDAEELFAQTITGLQHAATRCDNRVAGIGVTAWGVDIGLLNGDGKLLAPIQHYRASAPEDMHAVLGSIEAQELFTRTGVLPQQINTIFRIRGIVERARAVATLDGVTALLVPDVWCAFMTGAHTAERSIASTTGLVSLRTGSWDLGLLELIGVDPSLLPPVVDNGSVVSPVRRELAERIDVRSELPFVLVASHDTASAVAAISGRPRTAFVSSGTWSLVGVERPSPIVTTDALRAGFTNEAGLGTTTLFMRNLTGLWLLEQAVRQWQASGRNVTIARLLSEAAAMGPIQAAFDVTAPDLVSSEDVLHTVRAQCVSAGLAPPVTPGEYTRCILQSLALTYRRTVDQCEQLTGEPIEVLHMIGGGSRNSLLRQLTADACGRQLRFGPVEATSLGSLITQAVAVGHLRDNAEAREVLARSTDLGIVDPSNDETERRFWHQLNSVVPTPGSLA